MTTKELSEEEALTLIEGMRARGELKFKSEAEIRRACQAMTRDELIDIIVAYWRKNRTH